MSKLTVEIAIRRTDYYDYGDYLSSNWRLMYRVSDSEGPSGWSVGEQFGSRQEAEKALYAKLAKVEAAGPVAVASHPELSPRKSDYNPHGLM